MRIRLGRLLCALAMLPAMLFAANNADVLDKNQILSAVRFCYYKTDHFWNQNGDKIKSFNTFKMCRGDFCAEYGVTGCDTIHIQGSYNRIEEAANGSTTGFDDIEFSWKHFFGTQWGHFWTARVEAIIPVGARKYSLRYGRWGGEFDLFVKKELYFKGYPVWYNLGGGYRLYDGYPSDQVRSYFEAGVSPFERFSILIDSQLNYGVYNGSKNDVPNLILYNNNYRLLNGRIYGVYQVHNCAYIYGGAFSHLWGRNVGTGGGFFVGSYLSF